MTHGCPFSVSFVALTAADSRHRELAQRIFTDLNDEKGYWMNSWRNDPETEQIQILATAFVDLLVKSQIHFWGEQLSRKDYADETFHRWVFETNHGNGGEPREFL